MKVNVEVEVNLSLPDCCQQVLTCASFFWLLGTGANGVQGELDQCFELSQHGNARATRSGTSIPHEGRFSSSRSLSVRLRTELFNVDRHCNVCAPGSHLCGRVASRGQRFSHRLCAKHWRRLRLPCGVRAYPPFTSLVPMNLFSMV